jgi:hypothetical protein
MVEVPVIATFGRLRQKEHNFQAILGYTVKPCLKKPNLGWCHDLSVRVPD